MPSSENVDSKQSAQCKYRKTFSTSIAVVASVGTYGILKPYVAFPLRMVIMLVVYSLVANLIYPHFRMRTKR